MRKIFLFLIAFLLVLGLAACGDKAMDFPSFNEKDVVELSAQEMIALFENIDYTSVDSETIKISTKGHIFVINESDEEDEQYGYTYRDETKMTIDATLYALMSEVIGDVRLHVEGTIDFATSNESSSEWSEHASSNSMKGSAAAYFVDGYLYLMVDGTYVEDGEEKTADFKQKLNQQVTQTMWDEAMSEMNPEDQIDNRIPQEYLDKLENGDFDALMEAIPSLKVYKDGNTHSIVFSVTKQVVLDSVEDMITKFAEATGQTMTPTEISGMVTEAQNQINEMVDKLEFTYVISITGNKITKIAEKLVFKSVDTNIDIDITTVVDFGITLPKFPTDLDTYDPVDIPGEGVFFDGNPSLQ